MEEFTYVIISFLAITALKKTHTHTVSSSSQVLLIPKDRVYTINTHRHTYIYTK